MKIGIIISVALVFLLSVLGFFSFWGLPDEPTAATSPKTLEKLELPTGLSSLSSTQKPNEDATEIYDQAFALYQKHHEAFAEDTPPLRWSDPLTELLVEAMHRGKVKNGFLDGHIPVQPGARAQYEDALETIPGVVLQRAYQLYEEGDPARAVEVAKAVWVLGRRAFESNVRLYNRSTGLVVMIDSGQMLHAWAQEVDSLDPDAIAAWANGLNELERTFRKKEELIKGHEPHVGDLLNIARNDQDPTFRVAAILKLGVVKFNPGNRGNARVIDQTLDRSANDPDPLIAKAAQAAQAVTEDQLHRIY